MRGTMIKQNNNEKQPKQPEVDDKLITE